METKGQNINQQVEKKQSQKSQTKPVDQNQTARVYSAGELSNTGVTGSPGQDLQDLRDSNTDRVTATDHGKLPNEQRLPYNENEVAVSDEEKIYAAGNKPGQVTQVNNLNDLDDEEEEFDKEPE